MESSPAYNDSNMNLLQPQLPVDAWSKEEDKDFESLLDIVPEDYPNRFEAISYFLAWKTVDQVKKRYNELVNDVNAIEAGHVQFPVYNDRNFWERVDDDERLVLPRNDAEKVSKLTRNPESRWTHEEHKLFLEGLEKLGKGDWRGISRQYVVTKTPTQVASHAQKYQMRKSDQGTTKRRKSIHDITLDRGGS